MLNNNRKFSIIKFFKYILIVNQIYIGNDHFKNLFFLCSGQLFFRFFMQENSSIQKGIS